MKPREKDGRIRVVVTVGARCLLGAALIYLGLVKILSPVDFLKVLREYHLLSQPLALNTTAALLPWLEVVCGLLLVLGIGVRGSAVISGAMLLVFTTAVTIRAADIQSKTATPFCAIAFDCGCGTGEVKICRKISENAVLLLFAVMALHGAARRERMKDEV